MTRHLLSLFVLLLCASLPAQAGLEQFTVAFGKALEYNDEKGIDKEVKKTPEWAFEHFETMAVQLWTGKKEAEAHVNALKAAWTRCFGGLGALDHFDRWLGSQDADSYQRYFKARNNMQRAWALVDVAQKEGQKTAWTDAALALQQVARLVEETGHAYRTAEAYNLISACFGRMPDKTLEDRREGLMATERFLELRQQWEMTHDQYYTSSASYVKGEKLQIAEDQKKDEKRQAEGYGKDARGLAALLMPNVAEEVHPLAFEVHPHFDELDYSAKGGPLPFLWWEINFGKDIKELKFSWFRRGDLFLYRLGASKFAVGVEQKRAVDADASQKPKPVTFFFDAEKKQPYAFWFYLGSDRDRFGELEVNMAPSEAVTPIFYKSAASWKTTIGAEPLWLFDDNANGNPGDVEVTKDELRSGQLGDPEKGTIVPLLDSMQVGKGPRIPFSQFVQIGGAWHYLTTKGDTQAATKHFNPEYLKTGKVKLAWSGPKPSAPAQLVIQGKGDFATAFFDVAGGKEVEVPAGEYQVIFGRIVQGKGAKLQLANLFQGSSKPFKVEAGKVLELKMGAPFTIDFVRRGDQDTSIDATRMVLKEASGCAFVDLHGLTIFPEVFAAKAADGKGAQPVGKFVRMEDPEFFNKAAGKYEKIGRTIACYPMPEGARDGDMVLKVRLKAAGMKVALKVLKHPLFGVIGSAWL
jgi:hypothetical protein